MRKLILLCLLLSTVTGLCSPAVSYKDFFVRVETDKKQVFEQEPVTVSFVVYSLSDVEDLEGKMPGIDGCLVKEVELPRMKTFTKERLGGQTYNTVTWCRYLLYPQTAGLLTIPSITFKGTVMREDQSHDATEDFFNDRQHFTPSKISLRSPGTTVKVNPLPQRPSDFSGGVGSFHISAQLISGSMKTYEPIVVRVKVSGSGNLNLVKAPVVSFPRDFIQYEVKTTDSTRFTDRGFEGSMIFEYRVAPKNMGNYVIPPISFTYFDLNDKAYKTIKTEEFRFYVSLGKQNEVFDARERDDVENHGQGFFSLLSSVSVGWWIAVGALVVVCVMLALKFTRK